MELEELKRAEWNEKNYKEFIKLLASFGDEAYGRFNARIIPDIGLSYNVRMPVLKKIAKEIEKNEDREGFYNFVSVGMSYEEKLLQGILFGKIHFKSCSIALTSIDYYILRINNWALCDSFASNIKAIVMKDKKLFFEKARQCLESNNMWSVRFGLVILNNYYTEKQYLSDIFDSLKKVKTEQYYVNMAVAWLISSCYMVDKESTKEFLSGKYLNEWCINKSIQKIVESLRVNAEDKADIKKLKVKKS